MAGGGVKRPRDAESTARLPDADLAGLAIGALVERGPGGHPPTRAEVDAFLGGREFPLVEGASVTFAFRGEADEVHLRHWVYGLPSSVPLRRVPGTDLWYHVLELPEGSRVEYKLEVALGRDVQWIQDPLNPHVARDPFGANSVAHGPGYEVPDWTQPDPTVAAGSLEERVFHSEALGGSRQVTLYRPARFRETRRYPLLLVHDGGDYLRYAGLKTVLDNLIHRLEIPGLVAALMHPPDRLDQYARVGRARALPDGGARPAARACASRSSAARRGAASWARASGRWRRWPRRCTIPASTGACSSSPGRSPSRTSASTGARPVFDPIADFVNAYRRAPSAVSEKVFVSCGTYESLIYENRSLVPLLQRTGMDVRFVEARDGHNWENWRDRLREGLSWLFPGPLWLVYE